MSDRHSDLIESLVTDLPESRQRVLAPAKVAMAWFVVALSLSVAGMAYIQPFRSEFFEQVFSVPLYSLEVIAGFAALIFLCIGAFRSATPGESTRYLIVGVSSFLIWLAVIFSGLLEPVLAPSMSGKRETCYFEALLYSTACAFPSLFLLQRRYSVRPLQTAFLAACWVATIPAYLMQLSCMHDVHHAMTHHLLPMLLTALFWLPLFYWTLKRRGA